MTIKGFIEKAHKGEYLFRGAYVYRDKFVEECPVYETVLQSPRIVLASPHEILLDTKAWKAVGKVEGWYERRVYIGGSGPIPEWHYRMLKLVDALAEGKTIEQYLETL